MKKSKKMMAFAVALSFASMGTYAAETLSLEKCWKLAKESSPVAAQPLHYKNANELELTNISTAYYPQISIDGQVTNQSDVFALPIKIPGIKIESPDKTQYQAAATINQLLWDGGGTSAQRGIQVVNAEMNQNSAQIKLYKVKETITSLYFNIIILQESQKVLENALASLEANRRQIALMVESGNSPKSNRELIEIEMAKMVQSINSVKADKQSLINTLARLIGAKDNDFELEIPSDINLNGEMINRLELKSLDYAADLQSKIADASDVAVMPKFFAFAKGGIGNPNPINMMENEASTYFVLGLKMAWTPFDWFTHTRKREIAQINTDIYQTEKADLLRNFELGVIRDKSEIEKYNMLITDDARILALQRSVVAAKMDNLKEGVINSTEYITEFSKLTQFEINSNINKIKMLSAKYSCSLKYGK